MKSRILVPILIVAVVGVGLVYFLLGPTDQRPASEDWRSGEGTTRRPPSGHSADETVFGQYFSDMGLVTSGWSGLDDVRDTFSPGDSVSVLVEVTDSVAVLVYVDDLGNRGLFTGVEREQSLTPGLEAIDVGTFAPGSYVARVVVNDQVLVRNL
ncbi:MAG: hypothetical protein ACE5KH_04975, partial [Candidatus Geothermarchaeales archaeon]